MIDAATYNRLVSAHGATMIFFLVPIFMNGRQPLRPAMIGTRDMAFPRVNLLGFWMIPVLDPRLLPRLLCPRRALNAGWTGYPPLTE